MQTNLIQRIIERAIEIQQIPAPTFAEGLRSEFVVQAFREEGLVDVEIDQVGNAYGCLPGENRERSIIVSAHTDTVFPQETDLSVHRRAGKISGPGIGDNSLGVAGLFGLLWALREQQISLSGDLWLVANVGEEGLGNLYGMHAVAARFGDQPLGYVILEGLAFGRLYHRGLGVKRYRITVKTQGGHSWVDYGSPSAIHELAALVRTLVNFRLPKRPRTTMNVGRITGGVSVNTIAPAASIELDLRSEDGQQLDQTCLKVEQAIHQLEKPGVKVEIEVIGSREFGEIPADHPFVQVGVAAIRRQGIEPELLIGSTDANAVLSKGYPAICIGLSNGGAAHTESEFMLTENLPRGLAQLLEVVQQSFLAVDR